MGDVVYLYRSLAYRNAAAEMLRRARSLPRGPERSAMRRYGRALRDLARTEAWLEGRAAAVAPARENESAFAAKIPMRSG